MSIFSRQNVADDFWLLKPEAKLPPTNQVMASVISTQLDDS